MEKTRVLHLYMFDDNAQKYSKIIKQTITQIIKQIIILYTIKLVACLIWGVNMNYGKTSERS